MKALRIPAVVSKLFHSFKGPSVFAMPEVQVEESRRFMEDSLKACGVPPEGAKEHAAMLLHADLAGHFSHGMNRLEFYVNSLKCGATNPEATPVILNESPAMAWVDGCDGLGATVGNFCMNLAMRKAKQVGVGWVSAKRCNHFGMAGWWAQKAKDKGLIGMACTNSSPVMVPTRAKNSAVGTNPIALCAPGKGNDGLLVDMASTAVALGKVEVQIHNQEPLPEGWALGPDGRPTTDADLAFNTGKLLPLGGFEGSSGYKGYGLGTLIEVFCSGLSGSNASHQVRFWTYDSYKGSPNLGQCFLAIDPNFFAPGFEERISESLCHYRSLEPVDPSLPVLAPGDKERICEESTLKKGTIVYTQRQIDSCNAIAKKLKIKPLQLLKG